MKLSIVIPVFNQTYVLATALQSIVSGAGALEYEIILVDDGSDSPGQIQELATACSASIQLQHLDQNSGKAAAVNLGIEATTGEYVIQLDADDTLVERWSEVFKQVIDEWFPDTQFCLTSCKTERGEVTQSVPGYSGELTYEQRLRGEYRGEYLAVFRGEFIREHGYRDLGIRRAGFEEYSYLHFLQAGKCQILPFVLRVYHVEGGEGLSKGWWQSERACERVHHLEALLSEHGERMRVVAPLEFKRKQLRLLAYRIVAGESASIGSPWCFFDWRILHEVLGCTLLIVFGTGIFKFGVLNMQKAGLLRRWG